MAPIAAAQPEKPRQEEPVVNKPAVIQPSPKKIFYDGPSEGKKVALTFDDGPDSIATPKILDILKKNNIKATFFIIGTQAKAHPDMVRRIEKEGHAIGNHSWSHPHFDKIPTEEALKQIDDAQEELKSIVGYYPSIVRPPYGALSKEEEKAIHGKGMDIIDWSVDTTDWSGAPTDEIMTLIHKELYPGGIILQHCSGGKDHLSNTIEALKQLIPDLTNQGYTFVTVPELLNLPDKLPD
ncbi:polysaccharide deacetylase family protein [Paenibacillus sepulcri]